ncbi:amino acid ABC transporter permease [Bacillus sp. ISL-40]|uniref:amino acid ABC transporter permease n=1 Tax=unclassified Bacillus (in: firmicutes) TaxID=185979 RepID=UPI001BE7E0DB|nr:MULTISPECIES: amino acid ABC transporter permease [unclassified Bacillus (in: firmicutes)]MBT2698770.1 amino acid ABC transporter permease [Bacillus sp. ISL-40]MBT2720784.1 amino acid ABC transporter permease [Bacillus sp. ISL-46]MBT2740936.1 amino acid ABC transporter permease [Bacillus sp. ISL-77]
MLDFSILTNNIDSFLEGLKITIIASLIALICSFILGTLIAVMRIAPFKPLNFLGSAYVEFIRNIPVLVIVFFTYLAGNFGGMTAGTIGLTIYTAAFIAEAIRAGIMSVPKGQMEAARSTGLSYGQAMRMVILPQAIKIVIPPLGNQFINLVKNSSLLAVVAGGDLMYQGDLISAKTYITFDTYIFVALFYLILTIPLSLGVGFLEKRMARSN